MYFRAYDYVYTSKFTLDHVSESGPRLFLFKNGFSRFVYQMNVNGILI